MRTAAGLLAMLSLYACGQRAAETPQETARPEPVVVYASYEDPNYLASLFAEFTRETGIPVTLRLGGEERIVNEVIEKRGSPPADLLLTRSVQGIWRAADEGALRPLQSQQINSVVPGWLRGPDGDWTAIGFYSIDVACNAERGSDCGGIERYEDLGKAEFRGRLCLSASSLAVNRNLIARLIAEQGVRPAELIVRGWVANLALPPFESEAALLQALETGSCGVAIVSGFAFRAFGKPTVAATWPQPGHFDVWAVGINRHARSPDAARGLAEWLVGPGAQASQSAAIGLWPANASVPAEGSGFLSPDERQGAAVSGFYAADAVKLAERARWDQG